MSKVTSHTPGPWQHIEKSGDGKRIIIESHLDGTWERMTCEVDSDDCCSETAMANARLIAAAPELLSALSQIISDLPSKRDWLNPDLEKMAKAAIAKAKGVA